MKVPKAASAVVAVVGFDGGLDLRHRQTQRLQLGRVGQHFEAVHLAAQCVDVGHARHGTQCGANDPVEQAAPFFQRQLRRLDREHEHLAQRRGDRRNAAGDARGQITDDVVQPLGHLLTGPVQVGAVLEVDRDVHQAVLRHRAQDALLRDAQHLDLDRHRDAALDLLGCHARRLHDDLHLRARHVGEGIDGQRAEGVPAEAGQQHGGQQHEQTLGQRELHKAVQHGQAPIIGSNTCRGFTCHPRSCPATRLSAQ
jgi:hypothetical protein